MSLLGSEPRRSRKEPMCNNMTIGTRLVQRRRDLVSNVDNCRDQSVNLLIT